MRNVLREEKKRLISIQARSDIEYRLSSAMISDSHNGDNGYMVRSLYFDTPEEKDYNEKLDGIELRRKVRLRVYSPSDTIAYLEIKQKEGAYQKKRSLPLDRETAGALIDGNYGVLLEEHKEFADECYAIMSMGLYRPKTIVEYNRKAFIEAENNTRITLDAPIRATESSFDLFSENLSMSSVFPEDVIILEVKYNGFLLSYVKQLLEGTAGAELSVSKYCLARTATLNYVFL